MSSKSSQIKVRMLKKLLKKETRECDNNDKIINLAKSMLEKQKKTDLKQKHELLRVELEKEIESANSRQDDSKNSKNVIERKY